MTKLNLGQLTDLKLLLSVDGIGPGKIKTLLIKFRKIENILSAEKHNLMQAEGISTNLASRIQLINQHRKKIFEEVKSEFDFCIKKKYDIVSVWDSDYPYLLKKIFDPPLLLYKKGNFDDRDNYSIAVVGTRKPTNYGKAQAEKISAELSQQNITIVSGLARGIDSIAHQVALRNEGKTIAVTGSGLDVIYPPENKKLYEEIIEKGIVISEFSPGTKPDAMNFPRRNRIISGLSLGCIVIETGITGGALQTASFALDQNREVFAIPGNLDVKQAEGTNSLIQKGEAKLIKNAEDILVELNLKLKPVVGENIPKPKIDLNLFEEKILNVLEVKSEQIDNIAMLTELNTSDCLVHLLSLEFKGLVKQLPGKVFSII